MEQNFMEQITGIRLSIHFPAWKRTAKWCPT